MSGKSSGTEWKCMYVRACVCTHLDVPTVPILHLCERGAGGEFKNVRGSSRRKEGRESEGVGWILLMHGGSRAAKKSCAEEECRLFPCVGRTGEPSWLQAGAVSP